jgi:hypothetical protein
LAFCRNAPADQRRLRHVAIAFVGPVAQAGGILLMIARSTDYSVLKIAANETIH